MFVNAALPENLAPEALKPGNYGIGGPLPRVLDIWRAGAPHLDIFSPDLYINFDSRCPLYHRSGNPLFIPEMQRDIRAASNFFYAIGQYDAIGVSPFGLESDPAAAIEVGRSYEVLAQMAPVILANQGKGVIGGVVLDKDHPAKKLMRWRLHTGYRSGSSLDVCDTGISCGNLRPNRPRRVHRRWPWHHRGLYAEHFRRPDRWACPGG